MSTRVLREAAGLLIDIHGQHENQTLLHRKNHLALLDLYAKEETVPLRKEMAEKFRAYQELSIIHITAPTRQEAIPSAVFC